MKKYLILLIVSFFFNFPVFADNKLAFIDLEFLFINSNFGKKISNELDLFKKDISNKLTNLEKNLISQEKKIKSMKNISNEDEYNKNLQLFKNDIDFYKNEKENLTKKLNNERNKQINYFIETIRPIIQKYMDENNIVILIDKKNIFIGKSVYEVTNEINKLINLKL